MQDMKRWVKRIPNSLSVMRIGLAFVFPLVPIEWRVATIVTALLSEFFDGYFARKLDAVTRLGQFLDPIADKLFVLSTITVIVVERRLSFLEFALIAMRDIVVSIGSILVFFYEKRQSLITLQPRMSGKLTTALQFTLLLTLFAWPSLADPVTVLTAIASCISASDYLYNVLHRRFDFQGSPS